MCCGALAGAAPSVTPLSRKRQGSQVPRRGRRRAPPPRTARRSSSCSCRSAAAALWRPRAVALHRRGWAFRRAAQAPPREPAPARPVRWAATRRRRSASRPRPTSATCSPTGAPAAPHPPCAACAAGRGGMALQRRSALLSAQPGPQTAASCARHRACQSLTALPAPGAQPGAAEQGAGAASRGPGPAAPPGAGAAPVAAALKRGPMRA